MTASEPSFVPTEQQRRLLELLATTGNGVLVTQRRNGRPQLSNITYHWDPRRLIARVSVTADRAKSRNAQRDPRVSLYVTDPSFWRWTVLDGEATVTAPATAPDDDVVAQLIALYRDVQGEHPDWDDYRAAMVRDHRQVLTLHASYVYGQLAAN